MNYFKSRSPREQVLILVMLGLILIFAIWQFAVTPVLTVKSNAQNNQAKAQRDLSIVQNGLPKLTLAKGAPNNAAKPFNRRAVIDTARQVNIAISRVQPESNAALKVWFEDTSSQTLYSFLTTLSREYHVDISRVNINRRDNGVVSAQITLVSIG